MSARKQSGRKRKQTGSRSGPAARSKGQRKGGSTAGGSSQARGQGKPSKAGKTEKVRKSGRTASGLATSADLGVSAVDVVRAAHDLPARPAARRGARDGNREVDAGAALREVLARHGQQGAPAAPGAGGRGAAHRKAAVAAAAEGEGAPQRTLARSAVALVRAAQGELPFAGAADSGEATESPAAAVGPGASSAYAASATRSAPARPLPAPPAVFEPAPGRAPARRPAAPAMLAGPHPPATEDPASRIPDIDIHELHRLPCSLGEADLYLIGEGNHRRLWTALGCHPARVAGLEGATFAVWAPNARRVSVVGDFCRWDGNRFPMRHLGSSGVFELFIPGIRPGDLYKYEVVGADGVLRLKTDPMAFKHEQFPGVAAIVQRLDNHEWHDQEWMALRTGREAAREPLAIYECHLASWARVPEEEDRSLSYREIAPRLAEHCARLGFTHVELMPVMEHPFGGSWGYQITGYYAPTSRHGTPDDFRFLVDTLHQAGIGVILDWVPAHFPNDAHALVRFDGTALYEHDDPRLGVHPDWDTLIFNFGRNEVRNFLVANALFWLNEFHADGLRVDAVASMLYLDYSRRDGEWLPNAYGGRENIEAIEFVRSLNAIVQQECPGALMIAEESTSWSGITRPVSEDGGMGFTFKWNLGWMHDTLDYFSKEPIHRRWHQNELTFAMLYEYSERFIMPLSHDEVVHGKGSILSKLPGDAWQKLANLRTLLAYQVTRPGKKLVFMGTELGQEREWDHDGSLDWHLADDPSRQGLQLFVADLLRLYREHGCLWRNDHDSNGFQWIDCSDRENSVLAYLRWDGGAHLATVVNLTPVPRGDYRIGVPHGGRYRCILSSDAAVYGGSNFPTRPVMPAEDVPFHGFPHSIVLELPPLSALVLQPEG